MRAPFLETRESARADDRVSKSFVRRIAPLLALAVLGAGAFGALAEEVVDEDSVVRADKEVAQALHEHASPRLTDAWLVVTNGGGLVAMAILALAGAGVLSRRRSHREGALLVSAYVGALAILVALKIGFSRPRPVFVDPLAHESTSSFPSGHATVSTAVVGALCFVLARRSDRRAARVAISAIGAAVVAAIGFSRLYLGVHYVSDVVAGWIAGATWLALCLAVLVTLEHRAR